MQHTIGRTPSVIKNDYARGLITQDEAKEELLLFIMDALGALHDKFNASDNIIDYFSMSYTSQFAQFLEEVLQ